ncbi:hypothetical protein [Streptomyces actinomycinicus]|uniref:hypothetical protein n=1 Tax=Streptomyces actinomycinicus TaxID=1695166 RepID=UPI001F26022E|nr:hypothetical protein [Streptomyces actinomycinicus]
MDAIVFADPTRSVRCVQAPGRALRLDVSGKTASLIVPVYIPPGADGENILGTAYETGVGSDAGLRTPGRLPPSRRQWTGLRRA